MSFHIQLHSLLGFVLLSFGSPTWPQKYERYHMLNEKSQAQYRCLLNAQIILILALFPVSVSQQSNLEPSGCN